jgi:4-amino-4-deoxy-L-arabinose transferase-like glycosyltransferase
MTARGHLVDGVDSASSVTPLRARHWRLSRAFPTCVALLALAPILYAMPRGLDLSYDSIQYLSAARNLLAGRGLSVFDTPTSVRPMTHFPPFYPAMIAAFGAIFGDVDRGAWVLNLVATVLTVLLVARLAENIAGKNSRAGSYAAAIAAIAAAVTNDLAVNATMLWSEGLFIVLVLATVALLTRAVAGESTAGRRHDPWLAGAALAAGGSALTRYAGIGFVGGGVFALLLVSGLPPRIRIRRALTFGAISIAPLCAWFLFNKLRAHTTTDRDLSLYIISRDDLWIGLETLSRWVFPFDPTGGLGMMAALAVGVVAAYIVRETIKLKSADPRAGAPAVPSPFDALNARRTTAILLIMIVTYGLFLLASISLVEHAASLDERLLSPALPLFIAMVIGAGCALLCRDLRRVVGTRRLYSGLRLIAIVALAASLGNQTLGLSAWARHMPERSLGLTKLSHSAAELLDAVRAMPEDARVYSNMPYVIYAFAGRVVSGLPRKMSETSFKPNPNFEVELRRIAVGTEANPAYLVFFDSPFHPPFYTTAIDAKVTFPTAERRSLRGGQIIVIAGH